MSELKLTQHPEITELLSVLEQNGLHKEQNEVKSLAAYIDEMEGQLSAMNEELMQMHREISTIRDSSLKVRCEKLISGAEKQLWQAATAIRTVKHNCLCMARNSVDTFKAKGKAALRRAVFAMKIPSTLALLQDMLERQAASAQKTAERLGGIQSELQEAGAHIQRAGRTLLGRPEPEDAEYEQNRGLLGKAQTVIGRMRNSLSSMAARTAQMVDRLTSERETPDSRHSVKEALRDLQAEQKYGEDFSAPAEPVR